MNSDVLDTIEVALTEKKNDLVGRAAHWTHIHDIGGMGWREEEEYQKTVMSIQCIDAALAEVRRLREAGPQWEPSDHKEDK